MTKAYFRWLAIGSLPILLSGCVAAVIPVVAGGVMAGSKLRHKPAPAGPASNDEHAQTTAIVRPTPTLTPVASLPTPTTPAPPSAAKDTGDSKPVLAMVTGLRELPRPDQGTPQAAQGEAPDAANFVQFAIDQAKQRRLGDPQPSIVLSKNVDVAQPTFIPCRPDEPYAVIIDIDKPSASKLERGGIDPGPLTPDLLSKLRAGGVQIIWLSGRAGALKSALESQLQRLGLAAIAQDIISVSRGPHDRKQLQRLDAATDHCILAMAGHKRSDFDELFDYVRQDESTSPLKPLWNHGWFLLSPSLGSNAAEQPK